MFNKVLIPLDGSELAEGILPFVIQLAKGAKADVVLLGVIDPNDIDLPAWVGPGSLGPNVDITSRVSSATTGEVPTLLAERPRSGARVAEHERGGPYVSQLFDKVHRQAEQRLVEVANDLANKGIDALVAVEFGTPAETIVRVAERDNCDLIAMSTRGRRALARGILGSVTDKVIHSSKLPVLTITPQKAKVYRQDDITISKVMAPLDGSPLAEGALPYVEAMASAMDLEIMLVRVVKAGGVYSTYSDGNPYVGSRELERQMEDTAKDYLRTVAERLRSKGLRVEWKLLRGAPAAAIVELAQETPQDIIALASHGRSGITRWIAGSVAEAVIRASGGPVLVIPPA